MMKIQSKNVFPILAVFVTAVMLSTTPAFADHATASVSVPQGTSVPGCEATNECYIPYEVTVDVGGVVTWSNDDSAAHTVTAGSAADGPSGVFDSSLFMAGTTFEHKFEAVGDFPYFCMVHPWMEGIVTVQADEGPEPGDGTIIVGAPPEDKTTVTGISQDGNLRAEITASNPAADEVMSLEIKFRDSTGSVKKHANYDIIVSQNGMDVLSVMGAHEHEGTGMHSTAPLNSGDKVDIKVTVLGFGLPDDQENWTGPKGEILMFNVVPEFGAIATMILAIAIISIIAVSAKSKLNIMPKL
jgi:predicted secreted protein with PEFG-CTERM motif